MIRRSSGRGPPPSLRSTYLLGQVNGVIPHFAEGPGPGQHARGGNCKHEDEPEAAPAPPTRVRDPRKHLQQAGNVPVCTFISAGHCGIAGIRN
jgi:hypothetical protein